MVDKMSALRHGDLRRHCFSNLAPLVPSPSRGPWKVEPVVRTAGVVTRRPVDDVAASALFQNGPPCMTPYDKIVSR